MDEMTDETKEELLKKMRMVADPKGHSFEDRVCAAVMILRGALRNTQACISATVDEFGLNAVVEAKKRIEEEWKKEAGGK